MIIVSSREILTEFCIGKPGDATRATALTHFLKYALQHSVEPVVKQRAIEGLFVAKYLGSSPFPQFLRVM